jgi:hypothetical protein
MWKYPKSALHQAAIEKLDRDREIARATAAATKLHREQSGYEIDKLAILAKTQRLRAERLARIDAEPKKPQQGGAVPRGKRVPTKV